MSIKIFIRAKLLLGIVLALILVTSHQCQRAAIKQVRLMTIENIPIAGIPDGIYQGSFSYAHFEYKVATNIQNGKIIDIKILQNRRSRYARKAEKVVERVMQHQSLNVDAVSGATTTSKALLKAIENSLKDRVFFEGM